MTIINYVVYTEVNTYHTLETSSTPATAQIPKTEIWNNTYHLADANDGAQTEGVVRTSEEEKINPYTSAVMSNLDPHTYSSLLVGTDAQKTGSLPNSASNEEYQLGAEGVIEQLVDTNIEVHSGTDKNEYLLADDIDKDTSEKSRASNVSGVPKDVADDSSPAK